MSREIKFRAWDKNSEVMYYSEDNQNDEYTFIAERDGLQFYYIDSSDLYLMNTYSVLMQFTGLKDKNGIEIYEGDIVQTGWQGSVKGVVVFKVPTYCVESRNGFVYFNHPESYEVIGNIYENKELLEEVE